MQYMNSPFTNDNTKCLLALQTRTVNGIRSDFNGMFATLSCQICGEHSDTLPNVLHCDIIIIRQAGAELGLAQIKLVQV